MDNPIQPLPRDPSRLAPTKVKSALTSASKAWADHHGIKFHRNAMKAKAKAKKA